MKRNIIKYGTLVLLFDLLILILYFLLTLLIVFFGVPIFIIFIYLTMLINSVYFTKLNYINITLVITVRSNLWKKNIDIDDDEIYSQQERENILEKVKSFYENELAEKDEEIESRLIEYRDLIVAYEELKQQQLYIKKILNCKLYYEV